jgi:hypothetical protein
MHMYTLSSGGGQDHSTSMAAPKFKVLGIIIIIINF